jgi:hypothetical protein
VITPEQAITAVERIVRDITGRKGIGNEWEEIDGDVRGEIMVKWVEILMEECAG